MHQPVERRVADAGAQRDRGAETPPHPVRVDRRRRIAVEQAGGDQAMRVEHERAMPPSGLALDTHEAAGWELAMLRTHRDLVAEHPGQSGAQPALLARVEPQQGPVGCLGPVRGLRRPQAACWRFGWMIVASAATRLSIIASVWNGPGVIRSRSAPRGTVG